MTKKEGGSAPPGDTLIMRHRTAIISVIACLAVTAPLPAQYELGVGNALDANPAVGAGGYNLRATTPDFRARNLVITGNVAAKTVPPGLGCRPSSGQAVEPRASGREGKDRCGPRCRRGRATDGV